MNLADELQKLQQLHQSGAITDEEFAKAKANLLNASSLPPELPARSVAPVDVEQQTRQWAMFLHFSLLAGFVAVPLAGLVAPVVIWQLKKDELPGIEEHWKIVANWMISALIYYVVCITLCLAFVGLFLVPILAILTIIFPILGGVKANNGEAWRYPMSFTFIK